MYKLAAVEYRRNNPRGLGHILGVKLTAPDGTEIWIDADKISYVRTTKEGCSIVRCLVDDTPDNIEVRETVDDIRDIRLAAFSRNRSNEVEQDAALAQILEVYPHLVSGQRGKLGHLQVAEENGGYPRGLVELAFACLWDLAPRAMQNPLAGGTLLGQILRSRDVVNPNCLRIDLAMVAELLRYPLQR